MNLSAVQNTFDEAMDRCQTYGLLTEEDSVLFIIYKAPGPNVYKALKPMNIEDSRFAVLLTYGLDGRDMSEELMSSGQWNPAASALEFLIEHNPKKGAPATK